MCHEASNPPQGKADLPEQCFCVFLCLTNSYESLTLKGCIVIQPNTAYSSCGKGEKGNGSACVPVDCLSTCSQAFPPCPGVTVESAEEEKEMLSLSAARKTCNLEYSYEDSMLETNSVVQHVIQLCLQVLIR